MVSPTPLHPGTPQPEEPLKSPEVLALNALLHSGRFDPQAYGVDVEMLAGYQQAWNFCQDYQDRVGSPPPVELFARSFPQIEILAGVDPRWAIDQLRQAHYEREARRLLGNATRAMREGDLEAMRDAVRELTLPSPLSKPQGLDITDPDSVAYDERDVGYNVPWAKLNAVTDGHSRGEFWLVGARLGIGKSQMVPCYAVEAAQQGARVAIVSCEMKMRKYAHRIHRRQAAGDRDLQRALVSTDAELRRAALSALPQMVGSIQIFDPSVMRMNLRGVENLCSEYDVVWVDHAGLLSDNEGRRAIDDWRVAAHISNTLKEYSLRFDVALGAAIQLNRESDKSEAANPKNSGISQSDAFGQDADTIVLLKRIGETSMRQEATKVREGEGVLWYTKFEPAIADFSEISGDEAKVRAMKDAERRANV